MNQISYKVDEIEVNHKEIFEIEMEEALKVTCGG